jgi:photosystem II stability/assembly factor-like uncharacterized protein
MRQSRRHGLGAVLALLICTVTSSGAAQDRPIAPRSEQYRFQFMGPANGGRISAAAGVPGDTLTYYVGAASGGVWKTTDGGTTVAPISDSLPVAAIGALAVAPANPQIVWAGTGEGWAIRDADVMGDGIYKSVDAGKTWKHVGLRETGRIGKIILHPTNPDIAYVCALGRATGPQQERGVYRTIDGGVTWTRTLFVNEDTGCSGLTIDPKDPNVLFAGTWQVVMHTWAMFSGGEGSGVYKSTDAGATWKKLDVGLPKPPVGKIDVAVAPSNGNRVFALIQTANQGSLWRSDDAGNTWTVVSWDRRLIGRAGYYIRVAVNPANADEVLVANSTFHRSLDGGRTFTIAGGGCGDCHDIWMDPVNPNHWVATGDNGVGLTRNHGRTFTQLGLPLGQMYHVAVDDRAPYWLYSNRQDNGTMRGPSTAPETAPGGAAGAGMRGLLALQAPRRPADTSAARRDTTTRRDTTARRDSSDRGTGGGGDAETPRGPQGSTWDHGVGGCESGFTLPTPGNPDIVWASCYGNEVTRFDARIGRARSVSPWMHTLDSEPNKLKYRCHWTPPLAIDPFEPGTVYYGCQVIFKTSNAGQTWSVISPDLSTRDSSRIVSSGGVVPDNLGQFYGEVVFAIAPSEIRRGLIWAGTNDGKIWLTRDGGVIWSDLTANVAGMAPWGTIRRIDPSQHDAATAYVAVDYHMMDDRRPFIFKTTDYGKTWSNVTGDLPSGHPLDYVMTVTENPNRKGMLFAGTGRGFYYSMDDGRKWTQLRDGLPAAPVTWIVVPKNWHDVVVSTYGRGLFVLRDITTLEQSDRVLADADAHLFAPRPAHRLARGGSVDINYRMRVPSRDSVRVEILDSAGTVIRTLRQAARVGPNRIAWDLRYDGPRQVELRTTPPDNPQIWEESRFKGKTTRPITHWGIQNPQRAGPLVVPGRYSVRLTAGGKTSTQHLRVLRDPTISSSDAALAASTRAQIRVRDAMNETVDMINRLEVLRKQVEDRLKTPEGQGMRQPLQDIDRKMLDIELRLLSKTDLHSDDKWYVESYKLYMNLIWLSGVVGSGAGDVAGGADYRPTDAALATIAELEAELSQARTAYKRFIDVDLPAFNRATGGSIALDLAPANAPAIPRALPR